LVWLIKKELFSERLAVGCGDDVVESDDSTDEEIQVSTVDWPTDYFDRARLRASMRGGYSGRTSQGKLGYWGPRFNPLRVTAKIIGYEKLDLPG